jgi:hypothetical protein
LEPHGDFCDGDATLFIEVVKSKLDVAERTQDTVAGLVLVIARLPKPSSLSEYSSTALEYGMVRV